MKVNFNAAIGKRLKSRRVTLEMTREKLAARAKISDKFLYELERGNKGMSAQTLLKLSRALDVSADWLLEAADEFVE